MPQDLQVAYRLHSEQFLMKPDDIRITTECKPRPDGWVQNRRADMEAQDYLMFPGN